MTDISTPALELDGTGTDSLLREGLERVADEMAARNSRLAIVVPVKEIIALFYKVFDDLPRVPDYDHPTALAKLFTQDFDYAPDVVPEETPELRVRLDHDGKEPGVRLDLHTARGDETCLLDLGQAEELFLTGLAAVRLARRHPEKVTEVIEAAVAETAQGEDAGGNYTTLQVAPGVDAGAADHVH